MIKQKKYLITTAIEETWKFDQPVIFLGEWCRVYDRRHIWQNMDAAQSSFISSTFWTERIGPTAGLKTLEIMEREKVWEKITKIGLNIKDRWQKLADLNDIKIIQTGIPALASFSIKSKNALAYKTLITQEMLLKGYLAGNSIYVCTEHNNEVIDRYFEILNNVFNLIGECEKGYDVKKLLKVEICHNGFKRLN